MFVFGHLGIGAGLVHLAKRDWSLAAVLVGTLLPDLIDKPLFYALVRTGALPSAACTLLAGTRTIGHTFALTLFVSAIGAWRRAPALRAIAAGMASHIGLDVVSDALAAKLAHVPFSVHGSGAWRAAFFPLAGTPFSASPRVNFFDHFLTVVRTHVPTEVLGLAILGVLLRASASRKTALQTDARAAIGISDSEAHS